MSAQLDIDGPGFRGTIPVEGTKTAIGKAAGNDVVIEGDPAVSRVHILLEVVGAGWMVTDVGSRNGTYLNGERLLGPRVLRPGDEMRIGSTRLVLRVGGAAAQASSTVALVAPPRVTPREKELLVALCRPMLKGSFLSEPASVREMAAELVVTESAIKKSLARLYDRFGLFDGDRRRGKLAGEAVSRGAVTLDDVRG